MKNNFDEIEVKCTHLLPKVPKTQWAEIQDDNPLNNPSWLKALQRYTTLDIYPLYFFIQDDNHLYGFASCYLFGKENRFRTPDQNLFGKFKRLFNTFGISFHPLLVCGHLKGSGSSILVNSNLSIDDKNRVRQSLISAIEKESKKRKLAVLFSKIFGCDKDIRNLLESRNYLVTLNLPVALLDIRWPNFKGYIKHIRTTIGKKAKDSVANNLNRALRGKVTFHRERSIGENYKEINSLFRQNFEKYNSKGYHIEDEFLLELENGFDEDLFITLAKKKDQISGAGLMIRANNSAYYPFIGIDRGLGQDDGIYFNLAFYNAIKIAQREGIKRIFYGNALYPMKITNGCKIVHSYDYFKAFNPWKKGFAQLWFTFHLWRMQRKFKKYSNSFIT